MFINKKLFDDIFLESHHNLAVKSLQTLNDCENIIFFKTWEDDKEHYEAIPISEWLLEDNCDSYHLKLKLKINIEFLNVLINKCDNIKNDWSFGYKKSKKFVITKKFLLYIAKTEIENTVKEFDTYFEIYVYTYFVSALD